MAYTDIGVDITFNASHNSNKWISLGLGNDSLGKPVIIGAGLQTEQRPGYPLNAQFYRKYWYHDDNGDGILDVSEVHVSAGSADTARPGSGPPIQCRTCFRHA